ncbi:hypothetical protein HanHA300_Chr14g0538791 [Helianthus annuus]|nr:hypothetical protein HanHA300_Chr14g0538791 [Helianthus annuus]
MIMVKRFEWGCWRLKLQACFPKLVHQWNSLTDKQVTKLRDEISSSVGIKKLVSEDDAYIVDLICA